MDDDGSLASEIDPPPQKKIWKLNQWRIKPKEGKLKEWMWKMKEWTHKIKECTMKSYLLRKRISPIKYSHHQLQ